MYLETAVQLEMLTNSEAGKQDIVLGAQPKQLSNRAELIA
jgi:hypothetical protein